MTLVKFGNGQRRNSLNPFFTDVFDSLFQDSSVQDRFAAKVPAVNIAETDSAFHIEMAAPGLKKEDFKISIDKNQLIVSSEKKSEEVQEDKKYNRREYSYSAFTRSFTLPEAADQGNVEAEYTDGILKIAVAKKEEAKLVAKEIAVK